MNKKIRIGIDPAFRKEGFAICIIDENNSAYFRIFEYFEDFILWFIFEAPEEAVWIVENAYLQKETWNDPRHVGMVQSVSQTVVRLIKKYSSLKKFDHEVHEVSPREKGKVISNRTFQNEVYTRKHLILNFKSTEDERCAYQLAIRRL